MLALQPAIIHLDEAGHVYLPTLGPRRTVLRLNAAASQLWRRAVAGALDPASLAAGDREFLDSLVEKGALRHEERAAGAVSP